MQSWHSLSLEKLTVRQQSPGKIPLFGRAGGIAADCLVQGWECSQANSRAMVGAAGHIPGWERTGGAGSGAPRRQSDVACGAWCPGRATLVDPSSTTEGSSAGDLPQPCFLPRKGKLFNPLHSSPPGELATQLESRHINKPTISASASRSNLRLLSEICCFPPPEASCQ